MTGQKAKGTKKGRKIGRNAKKCGGRGGRTEAVVRPRGNARAELSGGQLRSRLCR